MAVLRPEWRSHEEEPVHRGAGHRDPEGGEAGAKTPDLARKHGVSEHTIYRWKAKYGGMTVSDAQRLKQLEDENRRLKHLVADLTLDNQALKAVLGKKW
jgi:putative transposase